MLLGSPACLAAGWWANAWSCRRAVALPDFTPTKLPGDDIAVIDMPTGGLCMADGGDIRITTADGTEMPCRVLMMGPGDKARVAFAIQAANKKYFVYFGNQRPGDAKKLDMQRGVLLEMWGYGDGGIKTLDQVRKVVESSKDFIGRDFRDRIFQGHNPYGPQNRVACVYTGFIDAPKKGKYVFATSSQDASFLLINDKLVVDNGGFHRPQDNVSRQGQADLDAGLHKVTFYHVAAGGETVAVAAWKPPGADKIEPIPAGSFAPVVRGSVGAIETAAGGTEVDFLPVQLGESFVTDRYFQRFAFEALCPKAGQKVQWQWDFGDGQKSASEKVEHIYLTGGEFTVTLTGKAGGNTLVRKNRVYVGRQWDRVTENKLDGIRQHASIVAKYDFATLSADAAAQAVVLLDRADDKAAVVAAGDALMKKDKASARLLEDSVPRYGACLVAQGKVQTAVDALVKGARMTADPAVAASLTVQAGRIALDEMDKPDAALKLFDSAVTTYSRLTTAEAIRQARIGLGDCHRASGDAEKAKAAYADARVGADAAGHQPVVLKGDYARHVEDYIRQKDLASAQQYVQRWADNLPSDKLEGYYSVMYVKLMLARNLPQQAVKEAATLVKVSPTSSYAAELLMLSADAHEALKRPDQAKAALQQIVEKYAESPLAAKAAARLKGE